MCMTPKKPSRTEDEARFHISAPTMTAATPQPQRLIHPPLNLAASQIRLLQVLEGESSSRICCTLTTYNVADAAPYIALSYTWGSEDDSQIVYINGAEFRVRKNLFDFLVVARRSLCHSLFWIDQICIDQDNVRERNHQVKLYQDLSSKRNSRTDFRIVGRVDERNLHKCPLGHRMAWSSRRRLRSSLGPLVRARHHAARHLLGDYGIAPESTAQHNATIAQCVAKALPATLLESTLDRAGDQASQGGSRTLWDEKSALETDPFDYQAAVRGI